jgi:hypothetical protein
MRDGVGSDATTSRCHFVGMSSAEPAQGVTLTSTQRRVRNLDGDNFENSLQRSEVIWIAGVQR